MIRKLFFQRLLPVLGVLLTFASNTNAQLVTLASPTPSAAYTFVQGSGDPSHISKYITFTITNNNDCNVLLKNVDNYHIGNRVFDGTARTQNNGRYELWYSTTKTTGPPNPVTAANGWVFATGLSSINTGSANGIVPIFKNVDITIQANSSVRFLIYNSLIMPFGANTTPLTVSTNNVTLMSGSATEIWGGFFPTQPAGFNYSNQGSFHATDFAGMTSMNFEGKVEIELLTPEVDVKLTSKPLTSCIGNSAVLTAESSTPGAIFTWRNESGTIVGQDATGKLTLNNIQLSDAGRYYVTAAGNCYGSLLESEPDSATLVVNDPPAPTITGKLDYCLNDQFEPITINGTNPKWYYDEVGGSPVPVTPTINTSSPNSLIYYVSQTDGFGCESQARTLIRFRVAPLPPRPIVNTPQYYCENAVVDQLSAIGDTLKWYYFPTGGTPTEEAPVPNTSTNDSSQYFVTQTIDGCESERSRIDIVVNYRPNGKVLVDLDNICAEDSVIVKYYGSAFTNAQFNWTLPDNGAVRLSSLNEDSIYVRLDSAGVYQFKLVVGFKNCVSEQYTQEVAVNALPYGEIAASQDACLGQPILIEAKDYTPGLDSFIWDFAGGNTAHETTEQGPSGVHWSSPGEKYLKVTFINGGCRDFALDTVLVHPKPSAKITGTYDVFSGDQKSYINVDYNEGDEICTSDSLKVTVETVEPGATYTWTPTRFFDTYTDVPITYARVDFNSNIYVEVEDIYGCHNTDSLKVMTKNCCEMLFPNAFTPNNDGTNDHFRPITVGHREIETFRIVNRYGQAVYESRQVNIGWDGSFNGQPAELGTYFFLISYICGDEKIDQGGEVILLR